MNEQDLKHVIALLLEDAKRLQQIEPNAGTEARILLAKQALNNCGAQTPDRTKFMNFMADTITPLPCNGERVSRVYHDTMVKALRIELDGLRRKIVMNEIVAN
ncbi:hypothetical protein [Citrobacter sp. Ce129]|uniref:hypothetical protein n=1 Tax=Citrobacter TaxID=544 RepID=UPI0025775FD4|nr:hypothetical protein [Citrobacter sp. Ce129]MDM3271654.1 hypothetical protein [Citrobacter sp. Ce129]